MPDPISDAQFAKNLADWPIWPFLPVKRTTGDFEVGFLFAGQGSRVYLCNIYAFGDMTKEQQKEVKTKDYDSMEDLFADGWRID